MFGGMLNTAVGVGAGTTAAWFGGKAGEKAAEGAGQGYKYARAASMQKESEIIAQLENAMARARGDIQPYADLGDRILPGYEEEAMRGYEISPEQEAALAKAIQNQNMGLAAAGQLGSGAAAELRSRMGMDVALQNALRRQAMKENMLNMGYGASGTLAGMEQAKGSAHTGMLMNMTPYAMQSMSGMAAAPLMGRAGFYGGMARGFGQIAQGAFSSSGKSGGGMFG